MSSFPPPYSEKNNGRGRPFYIALDSLSGARFCRASTDHWLFSPAALLRVLCVMLYCNQLETGLPLRYVNLEAGFPALGGAGLTVCRIRMCQ
jgi:hypothetical protein